MGNTTSTNWQNDPVTHQDVIGTVFGRSDYNNYATNDIGDFVNVSSPEYRKAQEIYSQLQENATRGNANAGAQTTLMPYIPASEAPPFKKDTSKILVYDIYVGDKLQRMRHYDDHDIVDHDCKINCTCIEGYVNKNKPKEYINELLGGAVRGNKHHEVNHHETKHHDDDLPKKKTQKKKVVIPDSDSDNDSLSDDLEETTEINLDDISSSEDEDGGGIFGEKNNAEMRRALSHLIDHDDDMDIYDDDNLYEQALENRLHSRESKGKMNPHRVNVNLKSKFYD